MNPPPPDAPALIHLGIDGTPNIFYLWLSWVHVSCTHTLCLSLHFYFPLSVHSYSNIYNSHWTCPFKCRISYFLYTWQYTHTFHITVFVKTITIYTCYPFSCSLLLLHGSWSLRGIKSSPIKDFVPRLFFIPLSYLIFFTAENEPYIFLLPDFFNACTL